MKNQPKSITSLTNDRVKMIRGLDMSKERKKRQLFVVEGASLILTGYSAGFIPIILVYGAGRLETETQNKIVSSALENGSEVLEVSAQVLEKISSKANPQSMLAVYNQRSFDLNELKPNSQNIYLALEQVRDPGNLGTIIRTAEAVGAECIFLIGQCCDVYSRECVRASMGSIFKIPIVSADTDDFLEWVRLFSGEIIATMPKGEIDYRKLDYNLPTLLLMGNESSGLTKTLSGIAKKHVKIPMQGHIDSLNLSVACALMLYQLKGNYLKI